MYQQWQLVVQGALYGAKALATGTGPFMFAAIFAAFTRTDSPLPYFPGAPFILGAVLMAGAVAIAATIDKGAGQLEPANEGLQASLLHGVPDVESLAAAEALLPINHSDQELRHGKEGASSIDKVDAR